MQIKKKAYAHVVKNLKQSCFKNFSIYRKIFLEPNFSQHSLFAGKCTRQGRSQTFIPGGGGPSGSQGGQAKFSKYFSLVENNLKLVLKFKKK